jgi:hypothetical protein
MADYFIDYEKVLADLESKRDAINAAIDGIKKLIHVSTQLLPDGTIKQGAGQLPESQEIASDTFFGMTVADAIEKYLRIMKKPQPVRDIAPALEAGGFVHTSQRFAKTVAGTLDRLSKGDDAKFAKIKGEWGLVEWYPGLKKSKAALVSRREDEDEDEDEEARREMREGMDEIFSRSSSPSESEPPSPLSRSAS